MSIVYDFPAIKARLQGDDWWQPPKLERPNNDGSPVFVVNATGCGEVVMNTPLMRYLATLSRAGDA